MKKSDKNKCTSDIKNENWIRNETKESLVSYFEVIALYFRSLSSGSKKRTIVLKRKE